MPRHWSAAALLDEIDRREPSGFEVPSVFTSFVGWLGPELTLGQRVIARVCYDGLEPQDLEGDDREMARTIFGEVEVIPTLARKVIVLVCGRRGGKSYMLEALRLVHAMYTVKFFEIAPGQIPGVLIIAPNDALRQEVLNYAIGAIRSKPELARTLIVPKGAREDAPVSIFWVRRPDNGRLVAFCSGVAAAGGYGGRGRSWLGFALDEAAFFRNETNGKVNDADIFKGALPGLLPGAQAIIPSTPWAQAGLLYEKFVSNWGHPTDAICAHAPTTLLRPALADEVAAERQKDPEYVEREFDAKFMAFGTTQFFSEELIKSCIDATYAYPMVAAPGLVVGAGGDLGFRSDSSAFAGTAKFPLDDIIFTARLLELRPRPGAPLKPGEVAEEFVGEARALGCSYIMVDQHYIEALREHAGSMASGKLAVCAAPASPGDVYVQVRTLMRDGRVKLPDPERRDLRTGEYALTPEQRETVRRLIQQLKEVQGRPIPGGGMSIILPRWRTGGHGDLVSGWVLSVYQTGGQTIPALPPKEGSAAWEARELAKRKAEAAEKHRPRRR